MEKTQNTVGGPPTSDVSVGVGLAGLAGLFIWLAICRNWPFIAPALGIEGKVGVLNGPYAALTALFFSGIPMVLWSLGMDKVHRRASTVDFFVALALVARHFTDGEFGVARLHHE